MEVKILHEAGHDLALRGMAYSFKDRALDPDEWWGNPSIFERATLRAPKLAPKGAGHNKFLRQIILWVDISAARCWWSEFDTYKVGTVAQSESTMHTLAKRPPTANDFSPETPLAAIKAFIDEYPHIKSDVTRLKCALPEGYLQRRLVTFSYENIRQIMVQRGEHRLRFWKQFLVQLLQQVEHREYFEDLLHHMAKE